VEAIWILTRIRLTTWHTPRQEGRKTAHTGR
jgi:hypothetical protein